MAVTLGEAILKIGADSSTFERKMDRLQGLAKKKMDDMASSVIRSARNMMLGAGAAIGAGLVYSIKKGMDAVESENLFEVSLGRLKDQARKWSEDLSKSLGLNQYELRKNVGTFDVMFKSMGLGENAAFDMAKGLTQLAYDMASFYNLKPEEAFEKLQAGISGEAEPLKRLGILINETTTKSYAMANGIGDGSGKLTEQEKVLARYGLIMKQTSLAQGDMQRTQGTLTNQLRIVKSRLEEAAISVGIKLLPPVQKMVAKFSEWLKLNVDRYVKSIADMIEYWVPKIAKVVDVLVNNWKVIGWISIGVVGIATAWKAARNAVLLYHAAVGAGKIIQGFFAERALKAGASVAADVAGGAAAGAAAEGAKRLAKGAAKEAAKSGAKEVAKDVAKDAAGWGIGSLIAGGISGAIKWAFRGRSGKAMAEAGEEIIEVFVKGAKGAAKRKAIAGGGVIQDVWVPRPGQKALPWNGKGAKAAGEIIEDAAVVGGRIAKLGRWIARVNPYVDAALIGTWLGNKAHKSGAYIPLPDWIVGKQERGWDVSPRSAGEKAKSTGIPSNAARWFQPSEAGPSYDKVFKRPEAPPKPPLPLAMRMDKISGEDFWKLQISRALNPMEQYSNMLRKSEGLSPWEQSIKNEEALRATRITPDQAKMRKRLMGLTPEQLAERLGGISERNFASTYGGDAGLYRQLTTMARGRRSFNAYGAEQKERLAQQERERVAMQQTVNINNLNVNAEEVVTMKNFGEMLQKEANKNNN